MWKPWKPWKTMKNHEKPGGCESRGCPERVRWYFRILPLERSGHQSDENKVVIWSTINNYNVTGLIRVFFLFFFVVFHCFSLFFIVFHGFSWFFMVSHGFSWFFIISHGFSSFLMVFHRFSLFFIVFIVFHNFSLFFIDFHCFSSFPNWKYRKEFSLQILLSKILAIYSHW